MSLLPQGLVQAFALAAGELGLASAARLYVDTVARREGAAGVEALREELGRAYPVLDAIAAQWSGGASPPPPVTQSGCPASLLQACAGARRVVVVGIESEQLDALLLALPRDVRVALVEHSLFEVDWERVVANHEGRLERVDLDGYQRWAGADSVLLTFVYGTDGRRTHVLPSWERVIGADVRVQFRSLIAWDVLGSPMYVYPRWLVEVGTEVFTHLV